MYAMNLLNIVASRLRKFFQCRNDLGWALLVWRMTAVVNYNQARVGQITRKAFSESQWNDTISTPPNHQSRQMNCLKALYIAGKLFRVYQTRCLDQSFSNPLARIVSRVLRRQRNGSERTAENWNSENFDEEWRVEGERSQNWCSQNFDEEWKVLRVRYGIYKT